MVEKTGMYRDMIELLLVSNSNHPTVVWVINIINLRTGGKVRKLPGRVRAEMNRSYH